MKEEIDEKTKCKLILIVLVIFTVLLLVFGLLLINHSKQINPDTVEVKPQQLIMGTELEEIEIIPIDVAYLVCSEEISLTKMVFDFGRKYDKQERKEGNYNYYMIELFSKCGKKNILAEQLWKKLLD